MTDDSPDRRKRSKWDETERTSSSRDRLSHHRDHRQEEREKSVSSRGGSRWDDRRSRSPPPSNPYTSRREERRDDHRRRSRSPPPVARSTGSPSTESPVKLDPAAAAAAAAARINASIQAKRGIQHVDVPPIKSQIAGKSSSPPSTTTFNSDMYIADGDYIKDIEVNDLRNRYTLTKGATQKMIKEETGADVTTRGAYYPDKTMATPQNPPLYLHITSTTKEGLEKAVGKIEELMKQDLPNLVDERRFKRREPPEPVERDEYGRGKRKWPEERIPVDLEPVPGFNLRAAVVGHGGQYVKHIQQETRCRVQIKGRGSGFMEHGLGHESDEPLYLHVTGPDPREVQNAKGLCEDLLTAVKQQYEEHKTQPQPARFPGYGGNNTHVYVPSMPNGQGQVHQEHQLHRGQPILTPLTMEELTPMLHMEVIRLTYSIVSIVRPATQIVR
ncbi:hypothetical protein Q9L58_002463 [Maublancomyces gigas]|uniref:K Homology domain-containing protein n=1 Tax=Discina gigas TaxID=1032678 RepID=A0ABR3GRI0_9PEZI